MITVMIHWKIVLDRVDDFLNFLDRNSIYKKKRPYNVIIAVHHGISSHIIRLVLLQIQ